MSRKKSKVELVYLEEGPVDPVERGAVYLRVSTPGQEEGMSLEAQREKCLTVAESLGVMVADEHVIVEVASGADRYRKGLEKVRDLVKRGVVGHVMVNDTTRLARDPLQVLQFIRHCKECGVVLHFGDGTSVTTAYDELVQFLKVLGL